MYEHECHGSAMVYKGCGAMHVGVHIVLGSPHRRTNGSLMCLRIIGDEFVEDMLLAGKYVCMSQLRTLNNRVPAQ